MENKPLKDLLKFGSAQQTIDAVRDAGTRIKSVASYVRTSCERTEVTLALHNLAERVGEELLRIAKHHDQGLDLIAWSTRNAFELNLLVRFVLIDRENARRFLAESARDEQQVLEGFLSLSNASSVEARQVVEQRIAQIDEIAEKHGVQLSKPMQTAKLAEIVGCSEEYAAMFKFMSKYVHPSSWLVNRPSSETQNFSYWNILLIHAQLYAMDSSERIREALSIPDGVSQETPSK